MLAQLGAPTVFGATELERFVDCSSAWLFERVIDPKTIDAEADAMLRGKVAHQTLYAFYSGLPKELGADRVAPETSSRRCASSSSASTTRSGAACRLELGDVDAAELREGLWRDLERFIHDEAQLRAAASCRGASRSASAASARRPSSSAASSSATACSPAARSTGSTSTRSARAGIVQDYKSGKGSFSARQIDDERRLQVPLYMLVLRDLVGIEPLGGVYRALSGARAARGMLRPRRATTCRASRRNDYLDEEQFWGQVETARERARGRRRSGSGAATWRTTRRAASARPGATSGRCAG